MSRDSETSLVKRKIFLDLCRYQSAKSQVPGWRDGERRRRRITVRVDRGGKYTKNNLIHPGLPLTLHPWSYDK